MLEMKNNLHLIKKIPTNLIHHHMMIKIFTKISKIMKVKSQQKYFKNKYLRDYRKL